MGITSITRLAKPPKPPVAHKPLGVTWADSSYTSARVGKVFVMPVVETANKIWRNVGGKVLKSKAGRDAEKAAALKFADSRPFPGEVDVAITWYRVQRSGDVDNRIKPALDLLKGIAYADDKQVRSVSIERRDDPSQAARMVVTVRPSST